MGHREKCLVRTPWADRSSTSAALCCCHCYSKSLCLDHCGQREKQVRAIKAWTAFGTNQPLASWLGLRKSVGLTVALNGSLKQNRPRLMSNIPDEVDTSP